MGTLLRPVGSLPPRVYWIRRAFLLVAVVIVVVALVLLLGPGSAGTPTAASSGHSTAAGATTPPRDATGTQPPATAGGPGSAASPRPSSTSARATRPAAAATPPAAPVRPCADSDIAVSTLTDARGYPPGVRPRLTLTVTNTSRTTCRRDLGSKPLTLLVTSGSQRIWSSDDCATSSRSAIHTLAPGETFRTSVIWARASSRPGCPASGRHDAQPGTYVVSALVGGLGGGHAVFTLQ